MHIRQAITQSDFFSLMLVRCRVFMCEQHIDPLLEIDEIDSSCIHYVIEENNTIIGTCRIIPDGDIWKIGRIAIDQPYRHKQYGTKLLQTMENLAIENKINKLVLGAQLQALPFYEKSGFHTYGDTYLDANIPHIMMEKCL